MIKYLVNISIMFGITFAYNYSVGEFISEEHQSIVKSTCYEGNGYGVGDDWKLADFNGATNGGHYNVVFIDMAATWWGACWTGHNGPAGYEHLDYEDNENVKFVNALADLNQPYSCTQWGNAPDGGGSQIIHDTGYDIHTLFNLDNYFPSTVFITHEMQIFDKMNNAGSWSIGSRIDQMLEDCGSLCSGEGCTTAAGDLNEDGVLNIQDLITMVNHILGSSMVADCALEASDMNMDSIVNIQDLISLVNAILGSSRSAALDGKAEVALIPSDDDLVIRIDSDINIAGVQLSLLDDMPLEIKLKDNSHISQESNFIDGVNHYLAYSMFNQTFDGKVTDIFVSSAGHLSKDEIVITVADVNGDKLTLTYGSNGYKFQDGIVRSFELSELYPNPFNPATEVSFYIPSENSHVKLSAYDIRGQEVGIIFEGTQSSGWHHYTWNASGLPSGVYYVHLQAGSMIATQKAVLIK